MSKPDVLVVPHFDQSFQWPVVSAEGQNELPRVPSEDPTLVTWLSLPLAAELLVQQTWDPQQRALKEAGEEPAMPRVMAAEYLTEIFVKFRNKMNAGSATVPYVHGAHDPKDPNSIKWLIPVGTGRPNYITGTTTSRISDPLRTGGRGLFLSSELLCGASRANLTTDLFVPRETKNEKKDGTLHYMHDPLGIQAVKMTQQWLSYQ